MISIGIQGRKPRCINCGRAGIKNDIRLQPMIVSVRICPVRRFGSSVQLLEISLLHRSCIMVNFDNQTVSPINEEQYLIVIIVTLLFRF